MQERGIKMENQYEKMSLAELRSVAKEKGITAITTKKKQELIDLLGQGQAPEQKAAAETTPPVPQGNRQGTAPAARKDGRAGTLREAAGREGYTPPQRESVPQQQGREGYAPPQRESVPQQQGREGYAPPQREPAPQQQGREGYAPPQREAIPPNFERRGTYGADNYERQRNDRGGYGSGHPKDNRQRGSYVRQQPPGDRSVNGQGNYVNQNNAPYMPEQRENVAANQMNQNVQGNMGYRTNQPLSQEELEQLDSGETKEGILEIMQEGFGFIRCDNFLPGTNDVYVSPMQIRKMNLKTGDVIVGNTKIRSQTEKFSPLLYVNTINGFPPADALKRPRFEDLTPIFPNRRIHLETPGCKPAMRIVDLISPIGKGQRGMIVSQPKAGKTTLLKQIAHAITKNHPEMHMIILLIDERPEEVTDIKESIQSDNVEVIYSTFDELPENHKRVSEMVIERAKRLVEHGKDVIILLDSITRLARAYNLTVQSSGRTLSGGLDPAALHMPKKFFGAARNMREGGSLTILATALVETGSRMDDVVFEEFKGTGNMEVVLDRNLSERRIFPAIDLPRSGTRREDLLLSQTEIEANVLMRRAFNGMKQEEAVERIIQMFASTKNNAEFIETLKKTKFAY